MESALERISAIPGVNGTFVVTAREVLARRFPAYLTTESLARTGPAIHRALRVASELSIDATKLILQFDESRILAVRIDDECVLVVWHSPSADMQALETLLEAVVPELREQVDDRRRAGESEAQETEPAPEVYQEVGAAQHEACPIGLTMEEKSLLREELARYVGPVAALIVDSATKTATSRQAIIDLLAREIEPHDRHAFIEAMERLDKRWVARADHEKDEP